MGVQSVATVTPEQYLEAERTAEFKSEYYDGSAGPLPHGHGSVSRCEEAGATASSLFHFGADDTGAAG